MENNQFFGSDELSRLKKENAKLIADNYALTAKLAAQSDQISVMAGGVEQMMASRSWRITAPLRWFTDFLRKLTIIQAIFFIRANGFKAYREMRKQRRPSKIRVFLRSLSPSNIRKFFGFVKKVGLRAALSKMRSYVGHRGSAEHLFRIAELDDDERARQQATEFPRDIKFSVLVPLYNTPIPFLREMIESVQGQTYGNWELCLADGSDDEHSEVGDVCREYAQADGRVVYKHLEKNLGISENTNACIDMSSGDFISLFDHDDVLHPSALFKTMQKICDEDADYVYTDEMTFSGELTNVLTVHFKPDYALDNLRANNYICHFSSFSRELLDKAGRFRKEFDGSQDHDLILRLTEKAKHVAHIPEVLYFWRSHPASVAQDLNSKPYAIKAGQNAARGSIERAGLNAEVGSSEAFPVIYRFKYEIIGNPLVSIIVTNKDKGDVLRRCIDAIRDRTTYDNYEIIVVDNQSREKATLEYYGQLEQQGVKVLQYDRSFNYASMVNLGASEAQGEYFVIMHSDVELVTYDWIQELLMYAQREDVGAVGGKLYFPNNTVEHAGLIIGVGKERIAKSSHFGIDKLNQGYMGRLSYSSDVSAVASSLMMVKRSAFELARGFNDEFSVAFSDLDFCLKLRAANLLNVFTPYCEAYHREMSAKGKNSYDSMLDRYNKDTAVFRYYWNDVLEKGDPYYNPNFDQSRSDFYF